MTASTTSNSAAHVTKTVELAFKEFLLALEAEGVSPKTIIWYSWHLRQVFAFEDLMRCSLDNVPSVTIRAYLVKLRNEKSHLRGKSMAPGSISPATIESRMRALKIFFNWCQKEYALDPHQNPLWNIKIREHYHHMPKGISLDDFTRLLSVTGKDISGTRDRALLTFLLDSGCRAAGVLGLTEEMLFLSDRRAIVCEKGNKKRAVFFTQFTADLISAWLLVRPHGAETIFCSLSTDETQYLKRLSNSGLSQLLQRLQKKAMVVGPANAHSFRHGFAREYLRNGGDLATLSHQLGHSNVHITSIFYTVYTDREHAEFHDRYSPGRDWKKKGEKDEM